MPSTDHNKSGPTLLVLLRLNIGAPNPLIVNATDDQGRLQRLEEGAGKHYHLLTGILDPSSHRISAPVSSIEINGGKFETYNQILDGVESLAEKFHGEEGFVNRPETFNKNAQKGLTRELNSLGYLIYQLFDDPDDKDHPLREWLARLMKDDESKPGGTRADDRPLQPVTIITNDFNIPWYWLRRTNVGKSLCEVCSLGMLQLQTATGQHGFESRQFSGEELCRALLINGTPSLPFSGEVLDEVSSCLKTDGQEANLRRSNRRNFDVQIVRLSDEINKIHRSFSEESVAREFRLVHFSGQYSPEELMIDGDRIPNAFLRPLVQNALVVLDGYSSNGGVKAWKDLDSITSKLLNQAGALGCVVSVLPVKDDPIAGRIFWTRFYEVLSRRGNSPVGFALAEARSALRKHFCSFDSPNPMWAFYQLIGSPVVTLFESE